MKWMLTAKESIKSFYERYNRYVNGLVRFCFALSLILTLIYNTGYNSKLSSSLIAMIIALICAFVPASMIAVIMSVFLIAEFSSVSIEVMGISAALIMVMLFSYFVFRLKNSWLMAITLMVCLWNLSPALLPLGLLISIMDVIPVVFGILLYGLIVAVKKDFSALSGASGISAGRRINLLLTDFFTYDRFILILITVVVAIIMITVIRKTKINYAALIASVAGGLFFMIAFLLGNYFLDVSVYFGMLIFGLLLDAAISLFIVHFIINMDYKRTEEVQFEDDEYFYFVKVVPKRTITVSEKETLNITEEEVPAEQEINVSKVFVHKSSDDEEKEE